MGRHGGIGKEATGHIFLTTADHADLSPQTMLTSRHANSKHHPCEQMAVGSSSSSSSSRQDGLKRR